MEKRRASSVQLRLHLPIEGRVPLEGTTRDEIVQILAQLLASAVMDAQAASDPEPRDESR